MMPHQDGVETCRQLREINELNNTYIIFLTARAEEYSEVAGFEAGTDDYITKPIKPRALISRLNAMIHRKIILADQNNYIEICDLVIDRTSYTITVYNRQVTLPKKDSSFFIFLLTTPIKCITEMNC